MSSAAVGSISGTILTMAEVDLAGLLAGEGDFLAALVLCVPPACMWAVRCERCDEG